MVTISIEAEATSIPTRFEVSIEDMQIGAAIHAKDVELPAGTDLVTDPEALVLHVLAAPTAEQIDAELAEAEAEAGIEHDAPDSEAADEDAAEGDGEATAESDADGDGDGAKNA